MDELVITFPVEPEPKRRHRMTRSGRCYTDAKTALYEKTIKLIGNSKYHGKLLTGPIDAEIQFLFKRPMKPSRPYPSKSDVTNLAKAIEDALNGVIWYDDDQIINLKISKRWIDTESMIVLTVRDAKI